MLTELSILVCCLVLSLFFIFSVAKSKKSNYCPKSYPIIGHYLDVIKNSHRSVEWTSDILLNSPTATFMFRFPLGGREIMTANPSNVQHMLKTRFDIYQKGTQLSSILYDVVGNGIFNVDGDRWKFQRQVAGHEFNTKSLRKFVETVVDTELSQRLIPILFSAAENESVLDFQDILQRFTFDNLCSIAFGYDPAYLLPSLPQIELAQAFEDCVRISSERFISPIWKIKKAFRVGSEKRLQKAASEVRGFAAHLVKKKKQELEENSSLQSVDLLSRFLSSGHLDETFLTDIVISFLFAGRDTTSVALTWFFWLLAKHPEVETNIFEEINENSEMPIFEEMKDMVYTHAALCESMRLYPPFSTDSRVAFARDVLPDGTVVAKGTRVCYHQYAMGRLEIIWGSDWADFKPERWLQRDSENEKWKFVGRDAYTYPVFHAGPRICLGKDMSFLQMKRVVARVLSGFKVVPATEEGFEPVFITYIAARMKDGFPVRIVKREISKLDRKHG